MSYIIELNVNNKNVKNEVIKLIYNRELNNLDEFVKNVFSVNDKIFNTFFDIKNEIEISILSIQKK